MCDKQRNLCVAADVTSSKELLEIAAVVGPYVCILKTRIDIIEDFSDSVTNLLLKLASLHNFLIMEDRKFSDIGNTVSLQYNKGVFRISHWADLVTAHTLPSKGIIDGLNMSKGIFLLAEMSSKRNLCSEIYASSSVKYAQESTDFVVGIVCQTPKFVNNPELIQLTPGVNIVDNSDPLGQQYCSLEDVVLSKGADIVVVGMAIIKAKNVLAETQRYKNMLWKAYLTRIEEQE